MTLIYCCHSKISLSLSLHSSFFYGLDLGICKSIISKNFFRWKLDTKEIPLFEKKRKQVKIPHSLQHSGVNIHLILYSMHCCNELLVLMLASFIRLIFFSVLQKCTVSLGLTFGQKVHTTTHKKCVFTNKSHTSARKYCSILHFIWVWHILSGRPSQSYILILQ